MEEDRRDVTRAVEKLHLRLPVALTAGEELLTPLGVRGVPATVFVDEKGTIVAAVTGPRDAAFFRKQVRELIERSSR